MLNEKQRHVAFEIEGNTIVSASPGTGKTKTLVARAQHKLESIPTDQWLALITYTNTAADEISSRLISDNRNIFIGTIHRFCLEFILRPFGWINGWNKPRIITYDELNEFVEINGNIELGASPIDELNKIKLGLDGELDTSVILFGNSSVEHVSELYFAFLKNKGAIDFNGILYRSYKIIAENDFVTRSLANKFYEISVDEFQDTNVYQYEILKAIQSKLQCTFFLVGDEKQKIYRFAGAIDNAFKNASVDFQAPIEELNITYRSTTNIINAYSSIFQNHPNLTNESKYKNTHNRVHIRETTNSNTNGVIRSMIATLTNKGKLPLSEIAILTNTWRDAFFISKHLRQSYHIVGLGALPHKSVHSSTFGLIRALSKFLYSPRIRNLRIIRRNIEFHALENNFFTDERELARWTNNIVSSLNDLDMSLPLLDGLIRLKDNFNAVFQFNHSDFDELIDLIDSAEAPSWTIEKYLKTLSGVDGVTVNTIHQSKGLEYIAVIVNGVSEGHIPYQTWKPKTKTREPLTQENLEDGRTKLYVAISRAKVVLVLLHNWKPSLFIPVVKQTISN